MTKIYTAIWVLPISKAPIFDGAVAVDDELILGVGTRRDLAARFPNCTTIDFADALLIPGLVNTHTHLELTAMRGYLEKEEHDFFAWLKKLTLARLELMTPDDLYVSAAWGACEAIRAGITSLGDATDSGETTMKALRDSGLRGIVFQESFGPDPSQAEENFKKLTDKIAYLRSLETKLVRAGVSPHAPYTVCGPQLESIAGFADAEQLPLMMHAAESAAEETFVRHGTGLFAEGLGRRGITVKPLATSTVQYLNQIGILKTRPLLAHCVGVDETDIETIAQTQTKIAHCPKSNAKLGHGYAPLARFLARGIDVGLGSDSVASNNTCDILEEARFAALLSRAHRDQSEQPVTAEQLFRTATIGGAACLDLDGKTGELREGWQADLTVLALRGTHQLPNYDPLTTAIFSSSGRDVVATIVAGKELYREGKITTVDEDRMRARIVEIAEKLDKVP